MHTVVLVEGESDEAALRALAVRRRRDLDHEGVAVVSMGGATPIGRFLRDYGPAGRDVRIVVLCDVGEERYVRRQLERARVPADGLFVCDADLEDELIRALGTEGVETVIAEQGELTSLRILQKQPAQLGRTVEQHLHRFLGVRSGRKREYARALVDALDLDRVPPPLDAVLDYVSTPRGAGARQP